MKLPFHTFFLRVWNSIAHPSRYREFRKESFWSGFWYLYWLLTATVFVTMATVLVGFFVKLPEIRQGTDVLLQDLPTLYPAELVVTLKNGTISTNVKEPYTIDLPKRWQAFLHKQENGSVEGRDLKNFPPHFITIDTKAGVESYDPSTSLVLVTRTSVVMPDKDTSYRVFSLDQAKENFTMNKQVFDGLAAAASPYVRAFPSILSGGVIVAFFIVPFVAAVFLALGYLFFLLLAVLPVWIIAAVMSRSTGYGDLYRLSLTALTGPILVTFAVSRLGIDIPFSFLLLYIGWMVAVLRYLPRQPARRK